MYKENAPTLPSKFNEPTTQNGLPPPSETTNLEQPFVADFQVVGPSVENPNKWKHHMSHECVSNKQTIYNKKMKASTVKVDKFKIDDFVSSKIDKVDKTSPPNPNLLLGKATEAENNNHYNKIVTKFGIIIIFLYISTTRLSKCMQTNVNFDYTNQITFFSVCKMPVNQKQSVQGQDEAVYVLQNYAV